MTERADHWESVYAKTPSTELSWYEREPTTSLRLIERFAPSRSAAIADIGAGASSLVDRLQAQGFTDLTALDISRRSLREVEERLGEGARQVTFIVSDVLAWEPGRPYDIWHDRAVFHFLTDPSARDRYVDTAGRGVRSGGVLVLGTFAENGPTQCSGLPVSRYSPQELDAAFSRCFALVDDEREEHVTPCGVVQPFTWVVLRRT